MQPYEQILDKFLIEFINNPEVIWIILCWSYITWNPTKHSDLDIQIILKETANYKLRWNKIIDGILIEYFVNPISQIEKYFKEDLSKNKITASHMIYTWKIILDKENKLKDLKKLALKYLNKKFIKPKKWKVELIKYSLWDDFDNLEEVYNRSGIEFEFVYFNTLNEIYKRYSTFLWFNINSPNKVYRLLNIETDKIKYKNKNYPDNLFVEKFNNCLEIKSREVSLSNIKDLTFYVLDKMWWFEIDGFKARAKI